MLAVPLLGQPLEPWTLAGLAVTAAGVALVNRAGSAVAAATARNGAAADLAHR